MNLIEVQKKILRLIEEINPQGNNIENLTSDTDIKEKLNDVIDMILFELCKIKKIAVKEYLAVKAGTEINLLEDFENFFQLNKIKDVRYEQEDNFIKFLEEGKACVYYYKFPKHITRNTDAEKYKFECTDDVIECLIYGVAADVLKSDVANNYGQIYANRYMELKQALDPRYSKGNAIVCDDGIELY